MDRSNVEQPMGSSALKESPLVTVGLPFSQENLEYLSLAIKSVFIQDYPNWELILTADNGSPELIDFVANINDPRVHLVNDGEQRGLARRLNQIAKMARGEILIRMDADDVMFPTRITRAVEVFQNNPEIQILSTGAYLIDENSEILGRYQTPQLSSDKFETFKTNPIIHPTVASLRKWSLANPYDENFQRAQDKELWVRALDTQSFLMLNEQTLFYRVSRRMTYSKHATSNKFDRRIIRLHGPRKVGILKTAILLARSSLKQLVFRGILALGKEDLLFQRRFDDDDLSTEARSKIEDQLSIISLVKIPQSQGMHNE